MSALGSMFRCLAVAGLLGIAFAADAQVAQRPTKIKLTLDWRFEGTTAYFHLAKAKGYFEQEGLDVQIDSGSGSVAAIQRVASGAYDMALGDTSSLIEFLGNNPGAARLQAVYMVYDRSPLAYVSLRKSGISSFADMPGKAIAAANFEATRRLWPLVAKAAGIDPASVTWMTIDPSLRVNAVLKGEAQVFGSFSPTVELIGRGIKVEDGVILETANLPMHLYGNAIVASAELIQDNPKAVAGFLRATNRALKEAIADPAAAVKYLKQRDPLVDEALETRRLANLIPAIVTDRTRAEGLGSIDAKTMTRLVADLTETFALKTKPNAEIVFNATFLPPQGERLPPAAKP